jgi:cyclohexanone monooxygenase
VTEQGKPAVDLDEVRRKYREERDKRIRGSQRAIVIPDLTGPGAHFVQDPYMPITAREVYRDEVDAIVIGAGFGGLLIAAGLRDQGIERIRLIDTAGDVGGVWYWNRYPGCRCDVDSLIYMPLLEELDYIPTERYARASEIFGHAQRIARHYRLYDDALFHTEVTKMYWDTDHDQWVVTTNRGDSMRAKYALVAVGPLSRLKLPDLPGLEKFEGRTFHTSRWDYSYTGGGPDEELIGLTDKVVGIVGTGATALQCVPPAARSAKHLYVFQRTPSTVAVRDNRPVDREYFRSLPSGWQARRIENFTNVLAGIPVEEDLIKDGWTNLYSHLTTDPAFRRLSPAEAARARELADFNQMESVRARIAATVSDPETAEALKPYYAYLCKRPGFHDEYLLSFNRPNVTLVDTQGEGIDHAYPSGVVACGREYELDLLIFATGFESETAGKLRMGLEIIGKNGTSLVEKWSKGLSTLYGIMTSNFPNFFIMPGVNAQSTVTSNLMSTMESNARTMASVVGELHRRNVRYADVDPAAETAWVETIVKRALDRSAFLAACTPGRNNYEGHVDARPKQNANFGGTPPEMYGILEKWCAAGDLAGLRLAE